MTDKIKKFFARKKADAKFKLAGPGHKLTESNASVVGPSKPIKKHVQYNRTELSSEARQAAEAAFARLNNQKRDSAFNTSLAAIQAQVRRELEVERKSTASNSPPSARRVVEVELEASPHLAVNGVYFRCPIISDEVLRKDEWREKIKEFLFQQLEEERGLTACLMIYSCNYNYIKTKDCIDVLVRYLDNIIANPTEQKFWKIRCNNATFKDKVVPILGATELLFAAGFREQRIESQGNMEDFLVFDINNVEGIQTLEFLREALKSEDRIELEVDRNLQVLSPSQAATRTELPLDFYSITPEELKKEQQLRAEAMEKNMQLRTKAMREKDELREIRKYKFALIRVRFPDGIYLQGTFSVYEKFEAVVEFIQDNLDNSNCPFVLTSPSGHKFEESDYESSLSNLRLVPATILNFQWEPLLAEEMARICPTFLKTEIMMLVKSI